MSGGDHLPHAVWQGEISVLGVSMKCFVLDDGRRIIDAESVRDFFTALGNPEFARAEDAELEAMVQFLGKGVPG